MQVVIDISDEDYKRIKDMPDAFNSLTSRVYKSIKNGTPLPKGHGRLIDADKLLKDARIDIWTDYGFESKISPIDVESAPTIIEADTESEDEYDG